MSAAWRRTSSVCAGRGRAGRLGGALEPAPKAPGKRHEAAPTSAGGRGLEPRYPGPRPGGLTSCPIPQGVSNLAIRDAIRFHKLSDTDANMCSYMPGAAPFTEGQLRVAIESCAGPMCFGILATESKAITTAPAEAGSARSTRIAPEHTARTELRWLRRDLQSEGVRVTDTAHRSVGARLRPTPTKASPILKAHRA
jgi:hypothetical protein